jgi:hypothetical protein
VLKYLASYTHRVAISNGRLVSLTEDRVSFRWQDSKDGKRLKVMTLEAVEFMRASFSISCLPASSKSATSDSWQTATALKPSVFAANSCA